MIYEVFNLDREDCNEKEEYEEKEEKEIAKGSRMRSISKKGEAPGDSIKGEDTLTNFISDSVMALRGLIEKHSYIKEAKISAKSTKRLKSLLDILKRGVEMEIKAKYENDGPSFTIDENFQTFFSHSNEDKRKELRHNVERFLEGLTEEYKEKYNNSTDLANDIKNTIEEKIRHLPTDLKRIHTKIFEETKRTLVKENDELITKASSNIISNPTNISNFFTLAEKAKKNGQGDFHGKCVKRFVDIYTEE
jgi:hypothetical protein